VLLGTAVGAVVGLVVFVTVPGIEPTAAASPSSLAGSQGIVGSLPATDSATTLSGQGPLETGTGPYANLQVTVNQTQNLTNQAVSVSWTGGVQTTSSSAFQADYLQIFECWGDPQSTDPPDSTDPGPLPTQCQFGAETTSSSSYPVSDPGFEYSRVLSQESWSTYSSTQGSCPPPTPSPACPWPDPSTGFVVQPFQAVDGTVVDQQADYNYDQNPNNPQPFWLDPYFRYETSNEVDFARTYASGSGQQLFQVQTGLEAPGLGCGQDIEPVAGGATTTPQCWLVVVPRGTPAEENPSGLTDESVLTSPLTAAAWANRIAFPIGFNSIGTSCSINAEAQQILGDELANAAVSSWQPSLCSLPGSPSYAYIENTDDQARQNIVSPTYGSAGMSVFSDPVEPSQVDPSNPIVYAPLTLSGVAVAFNIERVPSVSNGQSEEPLAGDQVQNVYLTPRLMAKLLTQSYQAEFENVTASTPACYNWVKNNPTGLLTDPDFLQWNPEFADLTTTQATDASTVLVEDLNSDVATAIWKWILADPEATAWLAGKSSGEPPGDGTMTVNPIYNTSTPAPSQCTNGSTGSAFASTVPENYPKSDPYCINTGEFVNAVNGGKPQPARPLCILDWSPYSLSMNAAAQSTGAANDGAKTTFNPAETPDTAWTANGPQVPGTHFIISITDSASAAQYGLQTASLSRAGDDGPDRTFVAPDTAGLTAGEQSMQPSAVPGVLLGNPSTTAPDAYPLTMLTYAATTPETLTPAQRQQYAAFILYAIGDGQTQGVLPGELPAGYVPLPGALRLEALDATNSILNPPPEPTTGSSSTSPTSGSRATTAPSGTSTVAESTGLPATGTGATTSPSVLSSTPTAAVYHLKPSAIGLARTSIFGVGAIRWLLPLALLIGLGAALGAVALDRIGRKRAVVEASTAATAEESP